MLVLQSASYSVVCCCLAHSKCYHIPLQPVLALLRLHNTTLPLFQQAAALAERLHAYERDAQRSSAAVTTSAQVLSAVRSTQELAVAARQQRAAAAVAAAAVLQRCARAWLARRAVALQRAQLAVLYRAFSVLVAR
jgi:hypothetical protein